MQCHFGLDTLAWARRGAQVTGCDLSEKSIELAKALSAELHIPADFICCDVYSLPDRLAWQFDIVFTSYGVLHWLRDVPRWGRLIAHFLKPAGIFYIVEDHPTFRMFTAGEENTIKLDSSYFFAERPDRVETTGDSAAYYLWTHSLGEVIDALLDAGLTLEFLHEFPYAARAKFPFMEQGADGWWRLPAHYPQIPFLFSLQARRRG